jgi:hypothetical protein
MEASPSQRLARLTMHYFLLSPIAQPDVRILAEPSSPTIRESILLPSIRTLFKAVKINLRSVRSILRPQLKTEVNKQVDP